MTTLELLGLLADEHVVEAYRLDRYDNIDTVGLAFVITVVEAYRLDRYDNFQEFPA